jgi:hypothetical protein
MTHASEAISANKSTKANWAFLGEPEKLARLDVLFAESLRSTAEAPPYFVAPYPSALDEIGSRRHQIVFGRRGSGKTSLLRKMQSVVNAKGEFCGFIDLEPYKNLDLPDQLISATLEFFDQLLSRYNGACDVLSADVSDGIAKEITYLSERLSQPDNLRTEVRETSTLQNRADLSAGGKAILPFFQARGEVSGRLTEGGETTKVQVIESDKLSDIRRRTIQQRRLIQSIVRATNRPAFLVFDDLYHLRADCQPFFVDHFHALFKGVNVWMKIGTLKSRSLWHWRHKGQTFGLEIPNDADELNLDRSFSQFTLTKQFFLSMVESLTSQCALSVEQVATEAALNRLVQASGGVARDFLSLLRLTLKDAQERVASECANGELRRARWISADDTWDAAARNDIEKRQQFQQNSEVVDQEYHLLKLDDIKSFCFENGNNCILIGRQAEARAEFEVLWDSKFIHIVDDQMRMNGKDYSIYCLDVGVHAADWTKRSIVVDLSEADARRGLRRTGLIFAE